MDVGRRSLSSENEFRERMSGRKKMRDLPLGLMLSFNDKDVHPECPNVSNPYHKCGRHCLDEIPYGINFLDAIRSDEDREWEKKSEKRGVNPNCPCASNPYHKCAEYCLENVGGVNPKKEVFTTEGVVKPACVYASKPYHACAESCIQTVPEKDRQRQSMRLKGSKEGEKVLSTRDQTCLQPQCKHSSNPNHECAESCFQSATDKNLAEGEKPKEVWNKPNKRSVHLNRKASSHSKVADFEDTHKKEHLNGDMKSKKENGIDLTTQRELTIECKNASNPYHHCDEFCFQSVPEREQPGQVIRLKSSREGEKVTNKIESTVAKPKEESEIIETVEPIVNLEYKIASNASHICPEFCSESVPESGRHEQVIRLKSTKEGDKLLNNRQGTGFDPRCKHASKSHHECTEFCFENTPDRNLAEGENSKGVSMETYKDVHGSPNHASSPYNKATEHYFEKPAGAIKPKDESDTVVNTEQGVNLERTSASNPHHVRAEYCFQSVPEKERHRQPLMKSKENKEAVVPLERVNPHCKHKSNPYHVCAEYCFQNVPNGHHPGQPLMKSKEEKKVVASPQVVNFDCKNASNPYHVCAEYCFENVNKRDPPKQTIKKLKEDDTVLLPSERRVSPECKFASNPYHVCAEYCFQNAVEREQRHGQAMKKLKEDDTVLLPSERGVSPECKFASNPYHVCAEYCFQNAVEREQHHGKVMKQKSLKELKNLFSKKKMTSEHPQCEYASNPYHQCLEYCFNKNIPGSKIPDGVVNTNERMKEKSYAPRRDDNPKYKNASNCAGDRPEEISPKNEGVDGSTATVKERRRNSSMINNRNHPMVEKIFRNSKSMATSKPSQNHIEGIIIMQDGTEKSSMNSKFAEAFNPTNNNFNSNNGISMHMPDETKDFQAVVDIMNPTDVPRSHIHAPDLSHEWAKYCSQKKFVEDEIVEEDKKKDGIVGEFSKRNGKGNGFVKDYDSANMEKVQATGGFPSHLLISLLILVGFLLALLDWTRVIHSFVMSSEKSEEAEKMKHERYLDSKCGRVSDPYHKYSHYCFSGVVEEMQ